MMFRDYLGECVLLFLLTTLLTSCCEDCDSSFFPTKATIFLINESSEAVFSYEFNYLISSGDTLIHIEEINVESFDRPNINTYQPFPTSYIFLYGNGEKCEVGTTDINNYDNRVEVADLEFELTFRFTEERRLASEFCN